MTRRRTRQCAPSARDLGAEGALAPGYVQALWIAGHVRSGTTHDQVSAALAGHGFAGKLGHAPGDER